MPYSAFTVNYVSAFLILILGWVLGSTLSSISRRILKSIETNKFLEEKLNLRTNFESLLTNILKYSIYLLTLSSALTRIGISTKILLWAILIIVFFTLLLLILAFKDVIPNILAWFSIMKTQKIKIGETITVKSITGKVLAINLIETKIQTQSHETIFIPNSILNQSVKEK